MDTLLDILLRLVSLSRRVCARMTASMFPDKWGNESDVEGEKQTSIVGVVAGGEDGWW